MEWKGEKTDRMNERSVYVQQFWIFQCLSAGAKCKLRYHCPRGWQLGKTVSTWCCTGRSKDLTGLQPQKNSIWLHTGAHINLFRNVSHCKTVLLDEIYFIWKAKKAGQCGCQRYKFIQRGPSNRHLVTDGAKQEQKEWQKQTNWCCSSLCCFPIPSQIRKWRNWIRPYHASPTIRRTPFQRHTQRQWNVF